MFLPIFRTIRETLLSRLSQIRFTPETRKALGIGAGGDRTFPVDRMAEDLIISELESSGLALSIISEELGRKDINGGGRTVLIDPIDGSKNAVSGIPFYCTSIAVAEGTTVGSIAVAYVVNLINGDEFRAEKGKGSFLNDERISAQKEDEFLLIAYEAQAPGKDIARILPLLAQSHKTRCLGATALDLAYLARGAVSVFVSPSPSRSFDFGAGWLLAQEAGAVCTDTDGRTIAAVELGLKKSTPLLASATRSLHDRALRLLNK
jgi:myo-inositol-1(or 4)-monophosphatase